jgi:hypothetical protein
VFFIVHPPYNHFLFSAHNRKGSSDSVRSGPVRQVVIADEQLRELAVGVVSLLDIVDAGGGEDLNSGRVVQLADESSSL